MSLITQIPDSSLGAVSAVAPTAAQTMTPTSAQALAAVGHRCDWGCAYTLDALSGWSRRVVELCGSTPPGRVVPAAPPRWQP